MLTSEKHAHIATRKTLELLYIGRYPILEWLEERHGISTTPIFILEWRYKDNKAISAVYEIILTVTLSHRNRWNYNNYILLVTLYLIWNGARNSFLARNPISLFVAEDIFVYGEHFCRISGPLLGDG